MTALFVTATGTDIGKTFVTAGLIRALRRAGRAVDAAKPVISGFSTDAVAASDTGALLSAMGRDLSAEEAIRISPWRFAAPLSPDMAAEAEGKTIDFGAVVADSRARIAASPDVLLIEGVGGIMVPLDDRHTVLDWMEALALPVLLVAGSYLGTISHTLTAVDALTRRGLKVAALVISETEGSTVSMEATIATLRRFIPEEIEILALPRLDGPDHPAFDQLAELVAKP
ncbi:MAG TPA: dethiobiotin synthase [Alphaproteobacteria bacterium]|jgi:dethiobiotin synthetase|nr:dethiobiotin synthase [Alphaproteobacteria bacterium]